LRLEAEEVHEPSPYVAKFSIRCNSGDHIFDAKDEKDHGNLYKNIFLMEHWRNWGIG